MRTMVLHDLVQVPWLAQVMRPQQLLVDFVAAASRLSEDMPRSFELASVKVGSGHRAERCLSSWPKVNFRQRICERQAELDAQVQVRCT